MSFSGCELMLVLTGADINLANTLIDEFTCRPHWTKNTRDVLKRASQHVDPEVSRHFEPCEHSLMVQYLARFKTIKDDFDPDGIYRSVVGEILGLYD